MFVEGCSLFTKVEKYGTLNNATRGAGLFPVCAGKCLMVSCRGGVFTVVASQSAHSAELWRI